ncbi:MAG: mercury methylation ferredoxin HgcB [Syntrophobacterales bacterium]|jgi:ferredoxin
MRKNMQLQYLKDVVTLELDSDKCTGCGLCVQVCCHAVIAHNEKVVQILDRDSCMECGACAMNCPVEAVTVRSGVGCAWAIFQEWFKKKPAEESQQRAACS